MNTWSATEVKGIASPLNLVSRKPAMPEERLPFTIRVVQNEDQLSRAVSIRQRAYGRHVPALGQLLRQPEAKDRELGCAVLLAESRLDGAPLGTMRIQTNRYQPLAIEGSVALPDWLAGSALAEGTRLGVAEGNPGRVVKTMLFKALYLYCLEHGIEWVVIGARPPLDRMYEGLLFADVFPGKPCFPMKHGGNLPHRVLALDLGAADARWRAARHPMYDLFTRTRHPDIEIRESDEKFDSAARHKRPVAAVAG